MTTRTISAENLGPIAHTEFSLDSPGVTVLVAPNGVGKSILLEAVQAAARGSGKLPLRDRTKKGKVEAFGATITIGGACRHTGSFEVTNLEGRFDLAALVDPRIKDPEAADRARIKALVALTGVEASANLFRLQESFPDFDAIVTPEALGTDDLIEMAAKIKACYDAAALRSERRAEHESGQAAALSSVCDIDMDAESDAAALQQQYNAARDAVIKLEERARNAVTAREQVARAESLLKEIAGESLAKERVTLTDFLDGVDVEINDRNEAIQELLSRVETLRAEVKGIQSQATSSRTRITDIDRQLKLAAEAKSVLSKSAFTEPPSAEDIQAAKDDVHVAEQAIEIGSMIRQAKAKAIKASEHRRESASCQEKAVKYRDAGKSTDEVLSSVIRCPQMRVESDGKASRLVTDYMIRGGAIPYHDLSDGEKWTIAIDIGADQVGVGGLLVISQIGWEGIDGANRKAIHEHAVKRGVYILTAEASSDPDAPREIMPVTMPTASDIVPDEVSVVPKPAAVRAKASDRTSTKAKLDPQLEVADGDDIPW